MTHTTNSTLATEDVPENNSKTTPQPRHIKSFVLRQGRLTTSQQKAVNDLYTQYTIPLTIVKDTQLHAEVLASNDALPVRNNATDEVTGTIAGMLDLPAAFGNDQPVILEIGFGMGVSLVEMAKANPNLNYLGIEVHSPGVGNCLKLIHEQGITNLRVIRHDAIEVLKALPNNSINGLQLFFPDPWHKARHHKRRIVNRTFMQLILPALINGGFVHFATDWENYAEHMLEVLSNTSELRNLSKTNTYIERPSSRPLTKFESRGERLGHGVWDLYFVKESPTS